LKGFQYSMAYSAREWATPCTISDINQPPSPRHRLGCLTQHRPPCCCTAMDSAFQQRYKHQTTAAAPPLIESSEPLLNSNSPTH
jgi:hypothetical protein